MGMAFPLGEPDVTLHDPLALDALARPEAPAGLTELNMRFGPTVMAGEQRLAVQEGLTTLVPGGGLQRGTSLAVNGAPGCGDGTTTLALALAAGAAAAGSWVAMVGMDDLGLGAMVDLGMPLDRVILIDAPAPRQWATVVAALFDAFDLILVAPDHSVSARDSRRLTARSRERGSVMIRLASHRPGAAGGQWGDSADLTFDIIGLEWAGLGQGHGVLESRQVEVSVSGRRLGGSTTHRLWLPNADGEVHAVAPGEGITRTAPSLVHDDAGLASVVPIRSVSSDSPGVADGSAGLSMTSA